MNEQNLHVRLKPSVQKELDKILDFMEETIGTRPTPTAGVRFAIKHTFREIYRKNLLPEEILEPKEGTEQ